MAARMVVRRLVAYAMHGRTTTGVIDYPQYFAFLAGLSYEERRQTRGDRFAAIAAITQSDDGRYVLRFVSGTPGAPPLLFDIDTGEERLGTMAGNEIVAATV